MATASFDTAPGASRALPAIEKAPEVTALSTLPGRKASWSASPARA